MRSPDDVRRMLLEAIDVLSTAQGGYPARISPDNPRYKPFRTVINHLAVCVTHLGALPELERHQPLLKEGSNE